MIVKSLKKNLLLKGFYVAAKSILLFGQVFQMGVHGISIFEGICTPSIIQISIWMCH